MPELLSIETTVSASLRERSSPYRLAYTHTRNVTPVMQVPCRFNSSPNDEFPAQ